jgi:hypothetical protein
MPLGLIIICCYAIFRRTSKPWLVAGRMLLVFFIFAIALQTVVAILQIANNEQVKLAEAISVLAVTILTGFRQSKNFPRSTSNVLSSIL